ncbi:MAG TPA: catabolite control protein A [Metalysinibacillus jejuensis]|uniref:Catabolite control protein A n=1 Tax=Metalysinibacillus jejuensis TaxID=914327 RepID=A0A921NBR7_9BACL|nr:catabolite control protein A [Metalysinibacillus jejuensis]
MTVTIYDVAREASVSMATVSRVVNGNPNVKPATRKRVLEVIERLGYRPNAVARGLASKKTTTVGVIIPDISNSIYAELVRGIEDIATMYNYNIFLANTDQKEATLLRVIDTMLGKQVDGIVLMTDEVTKAVKQAMEASPVPIVLAGSVDETETIPSVNINYFDAVYEATSLLLQNNENVALIVGPETYTINRIYKVEAYQKALADAGRPYHEHLVTSVTTGYEGAITAVEKMVQQTIEPTAYLAGSDEIALGIIHGLQDNNRHVPNEVEVMSCEDTKLAQMVRPKLTSIVLPLYDIGAVAMRLLTKFMNKEEIEEQTVILPYRIEWRDSTKK